MKKISIITVLALACLSGCSGKSVEDVAKEHVKKSLLAEVGNAAEVNNFKKLSVKEGDFFGVKYNDVKYSYDLLCKLPVPIKPLRRYSIEDVILLDEFFKNQTEPWDKIDFTPVLRVRLDPVTRRAVSEAYAKKQSLMFCKPGQKVEMTGRVRLLLRKDGWTVK